MLNLQLFVPIMANMAHKIGEAGFSYTLDNLHLAVQTSGHVHFEFTAVGYNMYRLFPLSSTQ